ncbi:MAG TPA: glycosyltransferase [Thermoanaerobaculia bacterium]|nr:glycosyltransferase [Thermoanaerobaculia bacterium]
MTPRVSVVIPTYNRLEILPKVLSALEHQDEPEGGFEIVVVDDGSSDGTADFLRSHRAPYPFRAFSQRNSGPAGARNRGVAESAGELVAFLGDDTVPEREFLRRHEEAHRARPGRKIAVLGYTTWPRDRRVTPFLHHINEYGMQFGYELIRDPENVPFNFFYTSNISLPRATFERFGLFDTTFPDAAWEDIEFSYRLSRQGYVIVYEPRAIVRHHHEITFASFRRRQERSGRSAAIFYDKHPELADFLGVGTARSGPVRTSRWTALWASLSERWEIPGGRRAIDRVLTEDYLRGLRSSLPDASPGGRADRSGGQ